MYDGFKWPSKWNEKIPDEIRNLEKMNGISGSQEYLSAMIDKIISCMPQDKIKNTCLPVQRKKGFRLTLLVFLRNNELTPKRLLC